MYLTEKLNEDLCLVDSKHGIVTIIFLLLLFYLLLHNKKVVGDLTLLFF